MPTVPSWKYSAYNYDFAPIDGQAFGIEAGVLAGEGSTDSFDVAALINEVRGTTGNPDDFGLILTSTLAPTETGLYVFALTSDDGSTLRIFDSDGNPVSVLNENGMQRSYLDNDFLQSATTRSGDVQLQAGETYTIEIRYWENAVGNTLDASVTRPSGTTESLATSTLLGTGQGGTTEIVDGTTENVDGGGQSAGDSSGGGFGVSIEEEASLDAETTHFAETVDYVAFSDTMILSTASGRHVLETGTVMLDQNATTLTLQKSYVSPVVIAYVATENGADPVNVRVSSISGNTLKLQLQEPNYLDGRHYDETVNYIVVEAGSWTLADGTHLEAGRLASDRLSSEGFESVAFKTAFDAAPVVLSHVQSFNGSDFVITRQNDASADGFQVTMQEEQAKNAGSHVTETLGWVAIDAGSGSAGGASWYAGQASDVTDAPASVGLPAGLSGSNVVAAVSSFAGSDPAWARGNGVTSDSGTGSGGETTSQPDNAVSTEPEQTDPVTPDSGTESGGETTSQPDSAVSTEPEQTEPVTLVSGSTTSIAGGRVTTLELARAAEVVSVEITDKPGHGNATVNPDNTIALVLSDSDYSGPLSLGYTVTYADGTSGRHTAKFEVASPSQDAGWGIGNHYMLATDASDDVIVETGDIHRAVYISGSGHALGIADIAAMEGVGSDKITADWLIAHPKYGGSEGLALKAGIGMELWRAITTAPEEKASSNWLMFERGYEYDDLGRIFERGVQGEDALHPLYVGSWGTGDRPVIDSVIWFIQEESQNIVFQDLELAEGILSLTASRLLFDNIHFSDEEAVIKAREQITIRNSEFIDITTDVPNGKWDHEERISGLYSSGVKGFLLEGNFFDHIGWEDGYDGTPEGGQPPNMFSHNVYFQPNVLDVTFRDNITMRAASAGAQFRGGVYAEENLFLDNNMAVNFLGGDYEGAGPTGNYTYFADNVITSGAHKVAPLIGSLTMGAVNSGLDTTLLDNLVVHLADPNNPEEFAEKVWTHRPMDNEDPPFFNDTIIYNWFGSRSATYEDLWTGSANGLGAETLNQTTIQKFAAQILGTGTATIDDFAEYIRAHLDGEQDVTAADVVAWFQAGFGVPLNSDAPTEHRFVPNSLADGLRWDTRVNWNTEDVPDDGDNVDLGGNWVHYSARTTDIGDLDLGAGGQLHVTSGKLAVDGALTADADGGLIAVDNAGQFWIDGYGDADLMIFDIDGGRLANTGAVTGRASVEVSDGQAILATGGARFELTGGSELRLEGSDAKVGFDGAGTGTALLRMAEGSVLTFDGDAEGFAHLAEFRSGYWDHDASPVTSRVVLDGTLQIDLSGLAAKTGHHVLIDVDDLAGTFDAIDIYGLASGIDARIVLDYAADELRLDLSTGSGQADISVIGTGGILPTPHVIHDALPELLDLA